MLNPLSEMLDRAEREREDSDSAYFGALMYAGEMLVKLVVAGLIAAVQDDRERHRYRLEHQLVRASGLGTWAEVIDDVLTGPSSQFLDPLAYPTQRDLTQWMPADTWQERALIFISESIRFVGLADQEPSTRFQGRDWVKRFVQLRNGTRGHGAPSTTELGLACIPLRHSILEVATNISLFALPWAYLHRNLSGKYRVAAWSGLDETLENLKSDNSQSLLDGVYVSLREPRRVNLMESDSEGSDYWFANGGFAVGRYEMLSYLTNDRLFLPSEPYLHPVEQLPPSETQGIGLLDARKNTFTNLPDPPAKYVLRPQLEDELAEQLADPTRHFIVTLTGRGGIGKTSTALQVINTIIESDQCPYHVVVWFSARDIDLLESGPKIVQPHGVSIDDFAEEYARLLNPGEMHVRGFDHREYLARQLTGDTIGPTLFVFDNFETTTSPQEVFHWLDTYVRNPNKVLITSRDRGFTGDYVVRVQGMTHPEAEELIDRTSDRLGIKARINQDYSERIIDESNGHPYIIKLLLGEVARSGANRPERIMAAQDEALVALFERSYNRLSPAAQRVFLTLSNWRSSVPALAVEAVLLRPENERMDVQAAIEELVQSSFVEESFDQSTEEAEVSVPLSARLFGLRKLEVSPWKATIEGDTSLLHLLGAQNSGPAVELGQRIERLFKNVATALSRGIREFSEIRPVLEFITTRYPFGSVLLADLVAELDLSSSDEERYLLHYVEHPESHEIPTGPIWRRIADIRRVRDDVRGELHALAQICRLETTPTDMLSNAANRINGILRMISLSQEEKESMLRGVVNGFQLRVSRANDFDSTDLSRLAWLQLHLDDISAAINTVGRGLALDPENEYCRRLSARLGELQ